MKSMCLIKRNTVLSRWICCFLEAMYILIVNKDGIRAIWSNYGWHHARMLFCVVFFVRSMYPSSDTYLSWGFSTLVAIITGERCLVECWNNDWQIDYAGFPQRNEWEWLLWRRIFFSDSRVMGWWRPENECHVCRKAHLVYTRCC
jgi:hypothetical protein